MWLDASTECVYCGSFKGEDSCKSVPGCLWDTDNNHCETCEQEGDADHCLNGNICAWSDEHSVCHYCGIYTTMTECTAHNGCTYLQGTCQACRQVVVADTCSGVPGCIWGAESIADGSGSDYGSGSDDGSGSAFPITGEKKCRGCAEEHNEGDCPASKGCNWDPEWDRCRACGEMEEVIQCAEAGCMWNTAEEACAPGLVADCDTPTDGSGSASDSSGSASDSSGSGSGNDPAPLDAGAGAAGRGGYSWTDDDGKCWCPNGTAEARDLIKRLKTQCFSNEEEGDAALRGAAAGELGMGDCGESVDDDSSSGCIIWVILWLLTLCLLMALLCAMYKQKRDRDAEKNNTKYEGFRGGTLSEEEMTTPEDGAIYAPPAAQKKAASMPDEEAPLNGGSAEGGSTKGSSKSGHQSPGGGGAAKPSPRSRGQTTASPARRKRATSGASSISRPVRKGKSAGALAGGGDDNDSDC